MKILTWNTAGARGTADAVALADRVGADALLLQEAYPNGAWAGPLVGAPVLRRPWGSWVLVRRGRLQEIAVPRYAGWVAGALWRTHDPGGPTFLFSIHVPTGNAHERRGSYVMEAITIVAAICAQVPAHGRLVIGGDFNVKSLGERLPAEAIQHDTPERRALQAFRQRGLAIPWRDVHPRRALPQTLRWRGAPATPFHCDGFLTRGFPTARMGCDVLGSAWIVRVSDHNPVTLQLPGYAAAGRDKQDEPRRRTRRRAAAGPSRA